MCVYDPRTKRGYVASTLVVVLSFLQEGDRPYQHPVQGDNTKV